MNADADIQVWLETTVAAQTSIIVPHVRSDIAQSLNYRIITTQTRHSGRSSIGQSGDVSVQPGQATALSRLAVQQSPGDRCRVTLIIMDAEESEHRYDFSCSDSGEDRFSTDENVSP